MPAHAGTVHAKKQEKRPFAKPWKSPSKSYPLLAPASPDNREKSVHRATSSSRMTPSVVAAACFRRALPPRNHVSRGCVINARSGCERLAERQQLNFLTMTANARSSNGQPLLHGEDSAGHATLVKPIRSSRVSPQRPRIIASSKSPMADRQPGGTR